jgi:hypothetical protein
MKSENVQSNTSAPFLAGSMFGKFHNEQSTLLTVRLLDDAKKIHTVNDLKDYIVGYREALTISDSSRQAMASMVRTILKVATGLDDKLCEYHKVKTAAAGQKVVKAKMDKGAKGIDSLAKALRIPSAPKAESDGESDSDSSDNVKGDFKKRASMLAWWAACEKLGQSEKYKLTTDEMLAFLAQKIAK